MSGWTSHVVTVAPTSTPVSADQASSHVVADSEQGVLVELYLEAAIDMVQAYTGAKLITQTITLQRAELAPCMPISVGPIQSISKIEYLDLAGIKQTLDSNLYTLVGAGTLAARIELIPGKTWPALLPHPTAVTLTAIAGYGDAAANVPGAIRQAILLLVGDFFANREDTIAERGVVPATLPNGVAQLLANYRVF